MTKDVIVHVHVLCYNESKIIPFILDYWNEYATKVFVYDNYSTDNSIELLEKENRFEIEIINFDSNNQIDDNIYLKLKNEVWKKSRNKCDFIIMCDFDEVLYSKNIMGDLKYMKDNNQTICHPMAYDMICEEFPIYKKGEFLHNDMRGENSFTYRKQILFNPNEIENINYAPGAHYCFPQGNVKYYDKNNIYLLHYKNLSLEYLLNKYEISKNRLSDINKKYGWGVQYSYEKTHITNIFNKSLNNSVYVKNIIEQ